MDNEMYDIIIIGAGAAGLMAAAAAGRLGAGVCVAEKNEKPGKKLYITGKGRCNLTNACDTEELFDHVVTNKKFLYSSFYAMTNFDCINFFEDLGLKTKIERGGRVFPASDKSSDVIRALWQECLAYHVDFQFRENVAGIIQNSGCAGGVVLENGKRLKAECVIVATGGLSYASTGSAGAGYRMAKATGHRITPCLPGLVPMNLEGDLPKRMQGLSMKNIEMHFFTMQNGKKREMYREFGEMMFTHFGITGPVVLSASSFIGEALAKKQDVYAVLDCKPALSAEKLDRRIVRDFDANPNSNLKNCLGGLLPKSMIPAVLDLTGLDGGKPVNRITKKERSDLVHTLKGMTFSVKSLRGWNEAIITRGGVSVRDINPSTMESRLVKNLYFAGEVIDIDALTGGFNLQAAWSTGYLAGISAAEQTSGQ